MAKHQESRDERESRIRFLDRVGRRLAETRAERGLSQRELSSCSGVSTEAIRCFENGTRNPTLGTLHDLALALGIGVAELVAGEGPQRDLLAKLRRALNGQPEEVIDATTACARAVTRAVEATGGLRRT